jgi:hypothetical protein
VETQRARRSETASGLSHPPNIPPRGLSSASVCIEDRADLLGDLPLGRLRDVAVDFRRSRHVGVDELCAHDVEWYPGLQSERGVRVAAPCSGIIGTPAVFTSRCQRPRNVSGATTVPSGSVTIHGAMTPTPPSWCHACPKLSRSAFWLAFHFFSPSAHPDARGGWLRAGHGRRGLHLDLVGIEAGAVIGVTVGVIEGLIVGWRYDRFPMVGARMQIQDG